MTEAPSALEFIQENIDEIKALKAEMKGDALFISCFDGGNPPSKLFTGRAGSMHIEQSMRDMVVVIDGAYAAKAISFMFGGDRVGIMPLSSWDQERQDRRQIIKDTGVSPKATACEEFGLWCRWDGYGWNSCDKDGPEAREDLNRLEDMIMDGKVAWDREQKRYVLASE